VSIPLIRILLIAAVLGVMVTFAFVVVRDQVFDVILASRGLV
jgi:hypothetical protein